MAKLMPVMEGKLLTNVQPVWVVNVHFVLDEDVKTKSCYKLREIVDRECGDTPFIVCGDFNFFPDRDAAKQREILESGWMDVGKTYGQRTNRGVPIEGTFLGYEHDQFKSPLGVENLHSRLDNIYVRENSTVDIDPLRIYVSVLTNTMDSPDHNQPELSTRNTPSDHLPLYCQFVAPVLHHL
jgi:endonuclease/exonuclease/phosphatase family metal-dependent hydrolase